MEARLLQPTRREFLAYGSAALSAGASVAAASPSPLHFQVIGDWGRDGAHYQRSVAAMMGQLRDTSFVVTTGDNFYQHGVRSVADRKWDSSFQRIYTSVPQPWFAVLGNHDYGGSVEAQIERTFRDPRWRMPYYWYDISLSSYGRPDIHLFFINTVVWRGREKFLYNFRGSSIRQSQQVRQIEWLKQRLAASRAAIKLVFGHHPIYSVRTGGSYYGMANLDALLFDHGVTAYFNGHDHCMYHISAPDWRGIARQRMHYICSGAGSQMRAVDPPCVPRGLASEAACMDKLQLGSRNPFWHAFFTRSETSPEFDLKGGVALCEVSVSELRIRFLEAVANMATGEPWTERHGYSIPLGIG